MGTSRTYSVPAVHCGHCKTAIEAEVGKVSGVDRVEGDAPEEAVVGAIDRAGYEVAGPG